MAPGSPCAVRVQSWAPTVRPGVLTIWPFASARFGSPFSSSRTAPGPNSAATPVIWRPEMPGSRSAETGSVSSPPPVWKACHWSANAWVTSMAAAVAYG